MPKHRHAKVIFIVEDDPSISELMKIIIEGKGFEVKTFFEIVEVESSAVSLQPSLIITDLRIPGQGGIHLVKTLKKRKETSEIPVVLVSADSALQKIAVHSKANGYLSKPFNIKDLVDIIKKFT